VKLIQRIRALLLLSILAGQACNQTAKPQEVAKPTETATPQAVKSPDAAKPQPAAPTEITLVGTGEFYAIEEPVIKNGERWLGLYVTKDGSSLIESKITVKPILDEETKKEVEGRTISVDRPDKPVFLVKGLTPGPAQTSYQGGEAKQHVLVDTATLASRKPKQLKLGDQDYQLQVLAPKASAAECPNCVELKIALVLGKQTQTIYSEGVDPENGPRTWTLLWAGDVDGDAKLDLYVHLSADGVAAENRLFLSSQAKAGQLVKDVASFMTETN
jgi:hypothetical protein